MDCNVIRDLIPLYVDECCTQESSDLVREHLATCKACQRVYSAMKTPAQISLEINTPKMKSHRINDWKASVLQSVLLYLSFGLIALGVMLEAATPNGLANGLWAYALVVPATANLFALANWYFIRLYKSKKAFSNCSGLITLLLAVAGYTWALLHYEFSIWLSPLVIVGMVLSIFFVVMSKILSNWYAHLLGKV